MARSSFQKLKLLHVMNYLLQNSDEEHPITVNQMIQYLESNGIAAERKSIYDDIEALRTFGMDIEECKRGRVFGYYVASRTFELPELKLLVDSVQSSKFITHKKTGTLIHKLESLASVHEAKQLNRQVFVMNRIKSMNESIYYNVDAIHNGIAQQRQIQFHYFEYNLKKEQVFRKQGAWYQVSPYALTWDDENYYMVAYDAAAEQIKHYRVDKMTDITMTDAPRVGAEAFDALDMGVYAKKVFGMFSGQERPVKLRVANHLVGAMLDRFGKEISIVPDGDDYFTLLVNVIISPQFFGWTCAFGSDIEILEPGSVQEQLLAHVDGIRAQYTSD